MTKETVLGIVGSPNREGRTNELVTAALKGAKDAGYATELVQMADHVVAACKDCLPWVCTTNLKCTYEDPAFEVLSEKVLNCGALVFGTPVYWGDTSGMVRYFILKMFRVYARSMPLRGLPTFGISIAGGTGNGLISGLRPLYHFFQVMHMRAIEPLPATRFNFPAALHNAGELGKQVGGMMHERKPFAHNEDRLLWYDGLPYLGMTRTSERRLLADHTTMAYPEGTAETAARGLVQADMLAASGRFMESSTEVTRVYETGARAFEKKGGRNP